MGWGAPSARQPRPDSCTQRASEQGVQVSAGAGPWGSPSSRLCAARRLRGKGLEAKPRPRVGIRTHGPAWSHSGSPGAAGRLHALITQLHSSGRGRGGNRRTGPAPRTSPGGTAPRGAPGHAWTFKLTKAKRGGHRARGGSLGGLPRSVPRLSGASPRGRTQHGGRAGRADGRPEVRVQGAGSERGPAPRPGVSVEPRTRRL